MRPRRMAELMEALAPMLEQALVVVLGAAVASISTAARRFIYAKHLESTVNTAMNMVRAAEPGATPQSLGDDVAGAVANWLSAHGHQMSAASAKKLMSAVLAQAQRDEQPHRPAA